MLLLKEEKNQKQTHNTPQQKPNKQNPQTKKIPKKNHKN